MRRLAGQPVTLGSDWFFSRAGRLNRAKYFSVLNRRPKAKLFANRCQGLMETVFPSAQQHPLRLRSDIGALHQSHH